MTNYLLKIIFISQIFIINNTLAVLNCHITPPTINFGDIDVLDMNYEETISTISVTCDATGTENVSYVLSFNGGSSNNTSNRIATSTNLTDTLSYNIYSTATYSNILADGSGNTHTFSNSYTITDESRTDHFNIYSRIPVQLMTNVGSYSDTIEATLVF